MTEKTFTGNTSFPNSQKIYVETNGAAANTERHNLRIPFREISLSPARNHSTGELEANEAVRVYDTSGAWGDPEFKGDVGDGLPAVRREWIMSRGDVEEYAGRERQPQDDGYLTETAREFARHKHQSRLEEFAGLRRQPLHARAGQCVTHMHYANRGIITQEMEYVALRENMGSTDTLETIDES